MDITIISDTVCPWCYIGKRRLEKALESRPTMTVRLHWRPFLLNPEMPPEGLDRSAYLLRKFGSEARIRRIYGAIEEAGQSVEIDFAFDRIGRTPNSVNSHRLVRFAERESRANEAVEAVFVAYFEEGQNIGNSDVLAGIGKDVGLDVPRLRTYLEGEEDVQFVYQENADAHRLGVSGVPSFVFNNHMILSGAHEPSVLMRMLDAAAAESAA